MSKKADKIERELAKIKKEFLATYPICMLCLQKVNSSCDLAHKIPRSYISKNFTKFVLVTNRKNVGLAHRTCHNTYDQNKKLAKTFPGYEAVMSDVRVLDIEYYNQTFVV